MKSLTKIVFLIITLTALNACKKGNDFSDVPELTVRDFYKANSTLAIWKIGFTDGDGDIGVRNPNDSDNFIVTIYSIVDGVPVELDGRSYRIPVVENIRTEKGIEGEFEFRIETDLLLLANPPVDSAYYYAYVLDRSRNKSNAVETPVFTAK